MLFKSSVLLLNDSCVLTIIEYFTSQIPVLLSWFFFQFVICNAAFLDEFMIINYVNTVSLLLISENYLL